MQMRVLALFLFLLPSLAVAQDFSALASGSGSENHFLLDPNSVRSEALSAFQGTLEWQIREMSQSQAGKMSQFESAGQQLQEAFALELDRVLLELRGDGLLQVEEVSDAIGGLRDQYLGELVQVLSAVALEKEPPPFRRHFTSSWTYAWELLQYTLLQRNPLSHWLAFLGLVAVLLMLAWLINRFVDRRKAPYIRTWAVTWEAEWRSSLAGPLYLTALGVGLYWAGHLLWIPGMAEALLDRLLAATFLAALFLFLWNASPAFASMGAHVWEKLYSQRLSRHSRTVVSRLVRMGVSVVFLLALIHRIFQSDLGSLITGLGIIGLALSFLLRGTIENLIATLTILGDRPFQVGDLVCYRGDWGNIEDIGFRSTRFRNFDGHLLSIPNETIVREAVHNVQRRPSIRRRFSISLPYHTTPEQVQQAIQILQEILAEKLERHQDHDFLEDWHSPHVVFESFGEYDLRLLVQYYNQPPDYWKALQRDSEINLAILSRFRDAGLEFAFPTEVRHVHNEGDSDAQRPSRPEPSPGESLEEAIAKSRAREQKKAPAEAEPGKEGSGAALYLEGDGPDNGPSMGEAPPEGGGGDGEGSS